MHFSNPTLTVEIAYKEDDFNDTRLNRFDFDPDKNYGSPYSKPREGSAQARKNAQRRAKSAAARKQNRSRRRGV